MKVITCACCLLLWIDTSTLAINEGLIKRNLRQLRDDEAESLLLLETAFFDSSMSLAMSKDEPSNGGPNSKSNKTPKSKSSKASIDLTKDLEYATGYDPDDHTTYSIASMMLISQAKAITGVRYGPQKVRAQLVLEKGKIVHEYYSDNQTTTVFPPKSATGPYVTEDIHQVTKSIMSLAIWHAFKKKSLDPFDTTLEEVFSNRESLWSDVNTTQRAMYVGPDRTTYCKTPDALIGPCTYDQVEYNIAILKNTTVSNILRMAAGLDFYVENVVNTVHQNLEDIGGPDVDLFLSQYPGLGILESDSKLIGSPEIFPAKEKYINLNPAGSDLVDTLATMRINPYLIESRGDYTEPGNFSYQPFSPILSYILYEVTGMMPSMYIKKEFSEKLGLRPKELEGWKKNEDGMEFGWSGAPISLYGLAKFALYSLYDEEGQEWVDFWKREANEGYGGHLYFDLFGESRDTYAMIGFFGHVVAVDRETERIFIQLVEDDFECLNSVEKCKNPKSIGTMYTALDLKAPYSSGITGQPGWGISWYSDMSIP